MPNPLHQLGELRLAAECCILAEGKILLQKRPDTAKSFPGFWTFPGGHIDENEDPLTAVIREVKEETNVTITTTQTKLAAIALNHHLDRKQIWTIFAFRVDLPKLVPAQDSEEGKCQWFDLTELNSKFNLFPPIQAYLAHILTPSSGVLYMSGDWRDAKLVKQHSRIVDTDY